MSLVGDFLDKLRENTFPLASAHAVLEQLSARMSSEEKAEAIALIARNEAEELNTEIGHRKLLREVVPNGWLSDYLEFTQVSESPDSFHLFAGIAVMSHLIGRRAWFNLGIQDIYAPLSVFLVSPAGQARRSSAIRVAAEIGYLAGGRIQSDTMTPEGLIDALNDAEARLLIVADEAATILSKVEYMASMPQILCTLLDCPPAFQRKLRGMVFKVEKPTVNALIGCAPEWISTAMPRAAIGGGLFSRMIVVYESMRKALIPLPGKGFDPGKLRMMKEQLAIRLRHISETCNGLMTYTKGAEERFNAFYSENDKAMQDADDKMAVYLSRKPDHLHRLNINLLASQGSTDMRCDLRTLEHGLAILHIVEHGLLEAYRSSGLDKPGQEQLKVLRAIERGGGKLDRSQLLQRVSYAFNARELDQVIDTLVQRGDLTTAAEVSGNSIKMYYSLTRR